MGGGTSRTMHRNLTPNPFPRGKGNRILEPYTSREGGPDFGELLGTLCEGGEDFSCDFSAFQVA